MWCGELNPGPLEEQPVTLITEPSLQLWNLLYFFIKKAAHLFRFLTLRLCLQHFHNNFLLFNKESPFDAVTDTLGTHGATIGPADMLLCLRQSHEDFRSHSTNPSESAWAHTARWFRCFSNLLGVKVNNPVARGSRQPSFVGGCVVGEPMSNAGPFWVPLSTVPGRGKISLLLLFNSTS